MLVNTKEKTIDEGMKQTGGYIGTDKDDSKKEWELEIQSRVGEDEIKKFREQKKVRRLLREKILCGENCQISKWSFLKGLQLNEHCPVDCDAYKLQN